MKGRDLDLFLLGMGIGAIGAIAVVRDGTPASSIEEASLNVVRVTGERLAESARKESVAGAVQQEHADHLRAIVGDLLERIR